jgi:hypothetical protein
MRASVETDIEQLHHFHEVAQKMGAQWADDVAVLLNQRGAGKGDNQRLLDRCAGLFEDLLTEYMNGFQKGGAPEHLSVDFVQTARATFHKRIGEIVLPALVPAGRA